MKINWPKLGDGPKAFTQGEQFSTLYEAKVLIERWGGIANEGRLSCSSVSSLRPAQTLRREGRRFGIGLDAERIGLAGLDELGGFHSQLGCHVVGGTDLVAGSPFRLRPILPGRRNAEQAEHTHTFLCIAESP